MLYSAGNVVNGGLIAGGAGGAGGYGYLLGGAGGYGAAAVELVAGGSIVNNGGAIVGGQGGAGGGGHYNVGFGGSGGRGVFASASSNLINNGLIAGGQGGDGAYGLLRPGGYGGRGGIGAALDGGTVRNAGTIVGGQGGTGGGSALGGLYNAVGANGGSGGIGLSSIAGGYLINTGSIEGGAGGVGGFLGAGTNPHHAVAGGGGGNGGDGLLAVAGSILNLGTIAGGAGGAGGAAPPGYAAGQAGARGVGVILFAGAASITNGGGGGASGALIEGSIGVYVENVVGSGASTVTNFGTIKGDVNSVKFLNPGGLLIAGRGGQFIGAIAGGGGTFELAGGAGTISGLGGLGVVSGTDSAGFSGFGAYVIGAGGRWTLGGVNAIAANQSLTVNGMLAVTGTLRLAYTRGTLTVGAGGSVVFSGRNEALSGTIAGAGTVSFTGGTDTLNGSTLSAAHMIVAGAAVTLKGTVTNSGDLIIETDTVSAGAGGATLVNQGGGMIAAAGGAAVTLNIAALANAGTLEALGGALTVTGAVSGTGVDVVDGGTLAFASTFTQNVTFSGASGILQLAQSRGYAGVVSGFSLSKPDFFDLRDIGFVNSGEASFSGTATGGTLTVTDGAHTAHVALTGNYLGSSFLVSGDGHGGVFVGGAVVDPPAAPPSSHPFIAAMAGLGAGGGGPVHAGVEAWRSVPTMLAGPGAARA